MHGHQNQEDGGMISGGELRATFERVGASGSTILFKNA
jgi:hypothetical protein